jgi:hypothetical protein
MHKKLALVAIATDGATRHAVGKFADVGRGDLFQGQIKLGADLGEIPQDITKLVFERFTVGVTNHPATVAEDFFDFAGDFSSLIGETQSRIDDGVIGVNETPRSP